jgi:hypothetical protein
MLGALLETIISIGSRILYDTMREDMYLCCMM